MDRMVVAAPPHASHVVTPAQLAAARETVLRVYMDDRVKDYIVNLVFATRDPKGHGLADLAPLIEYGASPRATIFLTMAARAHAFLTAHPDSPYRGRIETSLRRTANPRPSP